MVNASVSPKLTRAGNELGAPTTYQLFLEREGVPALGGFLIEDINHVDVVALAAGGRARRVSES